MKIKSIEITHIKGIKNKSFEFDFIPNKPNLLVASNGFGKTSFATAFDAMNSARIVLDKSDYYKNDESKLPEIILRIEDDGGNEDLLEVNNTSNSLSKKIDVFVINSQIIAKATKQNFGNFLSATASLVITPIVLEKIPIKQNFNYSYLKQKNDFGCNGKVLPNITDVFSNYSLIEKIFKEIDFSKLSGQRIQKKISKFIAFINSKKGNAEEIKQAIVEKEGDCLSGIVDLKKLVEIIKADKDIKTNIVALLASVQFIKMYSLEKNVFKKACIYSGYLLRKSKYNKLIESFYSGWANVKIKEDRKKKELFVEFPGAHHISNGERDILSFVFLFERFRNKFRKTHCMLIIDEIFDYLDDANLVVFQYYITQLIKEFKEEKRELFVMLLTHLNPRLFHHFCFGEHKIKVHYLDKKKPSKSKNSIKLIEYRERDSDVKKILEKWYFHYHPDLDKKNWETQFDKYNLKKDWGRPSIFKEYIDGQLSRYLNKKNYDSVAVCFSLRLRIENKIYDLIPDKKDKKNYLKKHGTTNKLNYADDHGVDVTDCDYLLGIIYNDALHWKQGRDIVSPIMAKLQHLTIKKLIQESIK